MRYLIYEIENDAGRILQQGEVDDVADLSGQAEEGQFFVHMDREIEDPDLKYISNPASDEDPVFKDRPNANQYQPFSYIGDSAPTTMHAGPLPDGTEFRLESNVEFAKWTAGQPRPPRAMNQGPYRIYVTPPFPWIETVANIQIDGGDTSEPGSDHEPDPSVKEVAHSSRRALSAQRRQQVVEGVYVMQALQTIEHKGSPALDTVDEFFSTRPKWRRQFEAVTEWFRLRQEVTRWFGTYGEGENVGMGMPDETIDRIFEYAVTRQGHDYRVPGSPAFDYLDAEPVEVE